MLDETYERILNSIEDEDQQYARRALVWLAFSIRPLHIEELAEAAVVDPQMNPPFDPGERFIDPPNNILEILSSLVIVPSISDSSDDSDDSGDSDGSDSKDSTRAWSSGTKDAGHTPEAIKLAHFSVKEYNLGASLPSRPFMDKTRSGLPPC